MKLKRRWFCGLLPAMAAGQVTIEAGPGVVSAELLDSCTSGPDEKWKCERPDNGQCPLCGAMAAPWKRPKRKAGDIVPCNEGDTSGAYSNNIACIASADYAYGPTRKIVECPKCSNAFFADAEADDAR